MASQSSLSFLLLKILQPAGNHGLIVALEGEIGAADGASKFGFLASKFETALQLARNFHPIRELESNRSLLGIVQFIEDIDCQTILIKNMCPKDAIF